MVKDQNICKINSFQREIDPKGFLGKIFVSFRHGIENLVIGKTTRIQDFVR